MIFLAFAFIVLWLYWSYRIWRTDGFWVLVKYNFYPVPAGVATAILHSLH